MPESLEERALRIMDLDPATHVVVGGAPKFSRWQLHDGSWRESVRCQVAERDQEFDLDSLVKRLHSRRPLRAVPEASGDGDAFIFAVSDMQLGKGEGGGPAGTVAIITAAVAEAEQRIKALRRQGAALDTLVICDVGDATEGVCGHYSTQLYTVQLDRREQLRLSREMFTMCVSRLAPLFGRVVLTGVPSNHSENRQAGKMVTRISDDDGLATLEQVMEAVRLSERYPQVELVLPPGDEPWVVLPLGPGLAIFHGHLAGSSDLERWWSGQAQGKQPVGEAGVLLSGHYHHVRYSEKSGRTWLQCPAADGGSAWWTNKTGQSSPPGVMSFVLGDAGVSDMQVLGRRLDAAA